jgi:hypothetical protein
MTTALTAHLNAVCDVPDGVVTCDRDWQRVIRRCRLFIVVWSQAAAASPHMTDQLAYAEAIGKPIRLLRVDTTRIPEDAFAATTDVASAWADTPEAAQAQIETWLAALPREGHP